MRRAGRIQASILIYPTRTTLHALSPYTPSSSCSSRSMNFCITDFCITDFVYFSAAPRSAALVCGVRPGGRKRFPAWLSLSSCDIQGLSPPAHEDVRFSLRILPNTPRRGLLERILLLNSNHVMLHLLSFHPGFGFRSCFVACFSWHPNCI